jgi:phosphohistidine phosphatase
MKALGLGFDLILSSPYVRARETAEIVARSLKLEKHLQLASELEVESTPQGLVRGLGRRDLPQRVLLVGHEPLFSETISLLLSGQSSLDLTMKKGGLARLTVDRLKAGRCAVLEWLLTPKQLCALG